VMARNVSEFLQFPVSAFQFLPGANVCGDINRNNNNSNDGAVKLLQWLINEREPAVFRNPVAIAIKWNQILVSNEWLSGVEHPAQDCTDLGVYLRNSIIDVPVE